MGDDRLQNPAGWVRFWTGKQGEASMNPAERDWDEIEAGFDQIGVRAPTIADLRLVHPDRPLSTAEQIADRIADNILSGEYPEGSWLRETPVAERFNVSRGPIREAFRLLEGDGLLALHANRGAMVTPFSASDLNEIAYISNALSKPASDAIVKNLPARSHASYLGAASRIAKGAASSSGPSMAISIALFLLWSNRAGAGRKMEQLVRTIHRQTLRYTAEGLALPEERIAAGKSILDYARQIVNGDSEAATATHLQMMRQVHRQGWDHHKSAHSVDEPGGSRKSASAA